MNGDEVNLDPFIQSLDQRGYALNLDPKRNVLQIVGKPGLKDPLTDDDFAFLRQNKSALMTKFIKAEDQPVTEPIESQLLSAMPGAALGTAGAALGETAAAKLGGGALMRGAGRLLGATGGNLAAENLPKELGGAEDPSLKRAALYGGVQEALVAPFSLLSKKAIGAGETRVASEAEKLAQERTAETAAATKELGAATKAEGTAGEALKRRLAMLQGKVGAATGEAVDQQQALLDAAQAQQKVAGAQQTLGYQPYTPDPSGLAANPVREAYLRAAQGFRAETGRPLGEAYENLKLAGESPRVDQPLNELERSLVSPISGKTSSLLAEGKAFGVATEEGVTPTLDQMREWRQRVSKELTNAKGGDRFALRRMLEVADDALEPSLPNEVSMLRRAYRGTMRVVPYEVDTGISSAVSPAQVAEHVFETPERAKGILPYVQTPEDKDALRTAFGQYVMAKVDPAASPEKQLAAMKKALVPYQRTGVVSQLFSPKTSQDLRDVLDAPRNMYAMQTNLADPKWRQTFESEFHKYLATPEGQEAQYKVIQGTKTLEDALNATDEGRKRLAQAPQFKGTALPEAQARVAGIEEHLGGGTMALPDWIKHRAMHHLVWAALGGGAGKAIGEPLIAGTLIGAAATGAWDTVMRAGAAPYLAKFLASDGARAAGRNAARLLAALGTQGARVTEAQQPQEVMLPQ